MILEVAADHRAKPDDFQLAFINEPELDVTMDVYLSDDGQADQVKRQLMGIVLMESYQRRRN